MKNPQKTPRKPTIQSEKSLILSIINQHSMKLHITTIAALGLALISATTNAQEHNIKYLGDHIYLQTEVNGKPANLVFDTGAELIYLDSTYVADQNFNFKLIGNAMIDGAGSDGPAKTKIIIGEVTVTASGKTYKPEFTPLVNLRPLLGNQADGIFGMKAISGKIISIDYKNQTLSLHDKLTPQMTEGYTCIPVKIKNRKILVPLTINVNSQTTILGDALMDMGSGQGIEITSPTATKHSLDKISDKTPFAFSSGGLGGKSAGYTINIANANIGNIALQTQKAAYSTDKKGSMASADYIANIGNKIWSQFEIILDFANSKIYLRKN